MGVGRPPPTALEMQDALAGRGRARLAPPTAVLPEPTLDLEGPPAYLCVEIEASLARQRERSEWEAAPTDALNAQASFRAGAAEAGAPGVPESGRARGGTPAPDASEAALAKVAELAAVAEVPEVNKYELYTYIDIRILK